GASVYPAVARPARSAAGLHPHGSCQMGKVNEKIRVALIGGSGYAGFEAIRWLLRHERAELVGIFGPPNELGPMEKFYPLLSKQVKLSRELFSPDALASRKVDLAMLCVPHKVAMSYVPQLRKLGIRVIDWSA